MKAVYYVRIYVQGTVEGGFMGRTNKLVDGCYSYWQGALIPLLQQLGPELLAQSGLPQPVTASPESSGSPRLPAAEAFVVPSLPKRKPRGLSSQAQDAVDRCQVHPY